MKRIIKNISLAAVLISGASMMTSCEDMLDKPSFTADDETFVFSNLDNVDLAVAGCYRGLIHKEQYYQYNAGDNITVPAEEQLGGSKWMIGNYEYDPILPAALYTTYNEGYRVIEDVNKVIYNLEKISFEGKDEDRRKSLLAECYTIRAFVYHNLIRFYGDVPANWLPISVQDFKDPAVVTPPRTSRDVIYDRVIKEVQDYVDYLPWFSESGYGDSPCRLTRQGALAVLARICLYAGGYSLRWDLETGANLSLRQRDDAARIRELYEIADDALAKIIQRNENSLVQAGNGMTSFQNLFWHYTHREFGVSSQEFLWQLSCYGTKNNSEFGLYIQPGSVGGLYGQRKTLQQKLPTYYLSFDPKDVRRDVTCCNYSVTFKNTNSIDDEWSNVGTTYSCVMGGKFRIQWSVGPAGEATNRNIDIPVIRYADVLLMRAETQNFLVGPSAGEPYLKQVRDRAGIGDMAINTSSKDAFLREILQERKWEFADEFLVRGDLIRMNLLDDEVEKGKQDLKDLSARTGKYANVPTYRLYRYVKNEQVYGDKFLTVPYIEDLTPEEIDLIKTAPNKSKMKTFRANIKKILSGRGIEEGVWYPVRMFEAWNSTYNKNSRRGSDVGFSNDMNSTLQIGQSIYTQPTAMKNGAYPEWVENLFYGYQKNKVELFPFANKAAGHPLVDNPNLTQHPGYM